MNPLSIPALTKILNAVRSGPADIAVTGVSTNSRTTRPGDCFFALAGENFDGHDFVQAALASGAACAVVSQPVRAPGAAILTVPDTLAALGKLAAHVRENSACKLIAVTGSVGKTTTRHIIATALAGRYRCHQSPKSYNNQIGLPLTILSAPAGTEVIVAEIGSNHPGEIAPLARIARPDIALVTNVCPAHLAGFGSMEAITREKLSIAEGLPPATPLLVNASLAKDCSRLDIAYRTFSIAGDADYYPTEIRPGPLETSFRLADTEIRLPLPGPGNLENAVAAWAACAQLGLRPAEFAAGVSGLAAIDGRLRIISIGPLTIIDDTYNANPASMKNALATLARLADAEKRRPVFIAGPMLELGSKAETLHAELGRAVAEIRPRLLITVGEYAETTARAAQNAGIDTRCAACAADLCNNLQEVLKPDDIILVKGSRAARLEIVIDKIKSLFANEPSPGNPAAEHQ